LDDKPLIQDFDAEMICDYFGRLERQGPGSVDATVSAMKVIGEMSAHTEIADLASGTGGQTMTLALNCAATITCLDIFPGFIEKLNERAKSLKLQDRVRGIVGSMDELPFHAERFDVIWCEGAIGNIGFRNALQYWRTFLKPGGFLAASYETWFTDERPTEIEKFWTDAVPEMDTIQNNVKTLQSCGYTVVETFRLPESCWIDSYFEPQKKIYEKFLDDNARSQRAENFVAYMKHEYELYMKYKQFYGYVFYVAKKI